MAKSKAQKQRQSLIRQGKLDPSIMRNTWGNIDPQTRRLPNKKKDAKFNYDNSESLREHLKKLREQCKNYEGEKHPEYFSDRRGEEII